MPTMHNPAYPGEGPRDHLPENTSVTGIARRLGVTRQTLSALLNQRAGISADMALRLEAAQGIDAGFLLRMQAAYDLCAKVGAAPVFCCFLPRLRAGTKTDTHPVKT